MAPNRALGAGAPTRTIAESFADLSRRVRPLDDFDEISICPYGKNARSGYREFVAIYARPTGKSTNDGVGKKLLHRNYIQNENNMVVDMCCG